MFIEKTKIPTHVRQLEIQIYIKKVFRLARSHLTSTNAYQAVKGKQAQAGWEKNLQTAGKEILIVLYTSLSDIVYRKKDTQER